MPALDIARTSPLLPARKHGRDLQFVADDVDWTAGRGWVLRGPGEAVLMAVAGRQQALDELSGPGLAPLSGRVRRTG